MTDHTAADKAFREWANKYAPYHPLTFSESSCRDAWQACESQMAERILTLEAQASGFAAETVSLRERVRSAVAEGVYAAITEFQEQVVLALEREAAAWQERIDTHQIEEGMEYAALIRKDECIDRAREIRLLPRTTSAHWLEKQLLDARIAERERIAKVVRILGEKSWWDAPGWTLHVPKEYANALFDAVYSDLTAERRALEGK